MVDVLTESLGRLCLVARGGRRDPLLQPFRPLHIQIKGNSDLKTLVRSEAAAPALPLVGEALYCGLYINEVLMRLLHRDDPQDSLLPLYVDTLTNLTPAEAAKDVLLRNFEFRLLDILGYGFSLDRDRYGEPINASMQYRLLVEQGLEVHPKGEFSGALLLLLAQSDWQPDVRRLARNLMRRALAPYLGDKPLASRELFRGVRRE